MSLFDLFKGEDPAETQRRQAFEARQNASIQSLEAGGLPLDAVDRLQNERARQGTKDAFFTSDLSVNEMALVHEVGFEPLGQVLGASTYHVGWQWRSYGYFNQGTAYELDVITAAFTHARQLALSRLWQEAKLLGAHGVVGVRLEKRDAGWADNLIEFSAIGTAIRLRNAPEPPHGPWLCDLSGQDFWKLHRAGWEVRGIAAGNCSYFCVPSWQTQNILSGGWFSSGSWRNQEMGEYTQAIFQGREIGQARLDAEVQALGATGVVGMTVEDDVSFEEVEIAKDTSRTALRFNFLAIGTAIRPCTQAPKLDLHGTLPLKIMRVNNSEFRGRL